MNKRLILWAVPAVIWLLFSFWYTDLGGPLSDQEVDEAMTFFDSQGIEPKRRQLMQDFLRNDSGRQFLMVNNIDKDEHPPVMPGFSPGASADDYMAHYMEHMYRELLFRASHPIFYASGLNFTIDVAGIDNAEGWDTAVLVRYRSKRTLLEIITNPAIGPRHAFKLAALTKTIAYPVETSLYLSDPRLLLFMLLALIAAFVDIAIYGRPAKPS
ncbi:MAG: hypothetical protein ACI9WS_001838 [Paraglaciecola psychrophila]|jgi:hypothetical protein